VTELSLADQEAWYRAAAAKEIERDRNQKDKPHGVLFEWDDMTLQALEWSEIIANARAEMQLVRDHLKQKSEELTLSESSCVH
jgi:hypothetical protein